MDAIKQFKLLFKHLCNNAHCIILDREMPLDKKVHALGDIQKRMIEGESALVHEPNSTWVHEIMQQVFDMGNPSLAGYVGTILHAYEQTYPEYS